MFRKSEKSSSGWQRDFRHRSKKLRTPSPRCSKITGNENLRGRDNAAEKTKNHLNLFGVLETKRVFALHGFEVSDKFRNEIS
jgi:hypothetical protein